MTAKAIVEKLGLEIRAGGAALGADVTGAYASDLLSDVIAHAGKGELWLTLQIHPNIVAVASLKELAGIVLVNGRQPEEETLKKAREEGIPIMTSALPTFQLAGRLFGLIGGC